MVGAAPGNSKAWNASDRGVLGNGVLGAAGGGEEEREEAKNVF